MLAAQHWKGTARSAKLRSPSSWCRRSRNGRLECRWVPVRTARVTWRTAPSPYTSRPSAAPCPPPPPLPPPAAPLPQGDEPLDHVRSGVRGHEGAVEGTHRRPQDQVG